VVFDVGGTVTLRSPISIRTPYLTIAGQTAPGGGFALRGWDFDIETHDVIVRNIRVRVGDEHGSTNPDGITVRPRSTDAYNIMIDHCSVSWGVDENGSLWTGYDSEDKDRIHHVTYQWNIISHGLVDAGHDDGAHSKGILVGDQTYAVSLHHNLFAHNDARAPELKGDTETEVINNVGYNWGKSGIRLAYTHDYGNEPLLANIIGNYSIAGVDSSSGCGRHSIYIGPVDYFGGRVYVKGNIGPYRTSDSQPENDAVCETGSPNIEYESAPISSLDSGIVTHSATEAKDLVLQYAGAIAPVRDSYDVLVIDDVINETGRQIDSQDEVGGFPTLAPGSPPVDTDRDGMPDAWETAQGLDPGNDDSAADRDGDGYTNIEEYINGLIPMPSSGPPDDSDTTPPQEDPDDNTTPPADPVPAPPAPPVLLAEDGSAPDPVDPVVPMDALRVPSDYPDIAAAYAAARDGDIIEFAPGTHIVPSGFVVDKRVTLASWFETRNQPDAIDSTTLAPASPGDVGFRFDPDAFGSRIVGLTLGEFYKPVSSYTHIDILWNHFTESQSDQVDLETGGGGTIAYNVFDNSGDDAVDCDRDNDVTIKSNVIRNADDDGIEIRLHNSPRRTMLYDISYNVIIGSGEDGIQLIDYDELTPREIMIHHNVISDSEDAGIGCMDDGNTSEDLRGCAIPELVVIYNNTIVGNRVGITGGDNMFVINNIIADNSVGLRRVDGASVVAHTLLWNGTNSESSNLGAGILETSPGFAGNDYALDAGSAAVDQGVVSYASGSRTLFALEAGAYEGAAPDLGGLELGSATSSGGVSVSAGPDRVVTGNGRLVLEASTTGGGVAISWSLEEGPGIADFSSPDTAQTNLSLSTQGRYKIRVQASNASGQAADTLVVTFASDERDSIFTVAAPASEFFEAEDYTLAVGADLGIAAGSDASDGEFMVAHASQDPTFSEYKVVTTAEGFDYHVWLRLKRTGTSAARLAISFDNGDEQTVTTSSAAFTWVRVAQPFPSPAGVYPLRVRAESDGTAWDGVWITTDATFSP
jgi:pectate lyase